MGKTGKRNWLKTIRGMVALAVAVTIIMSASSVQAYAATESQKEEVKQMMIDAFYNMDTSEKNIFQYRLSKDEFLELCKEVRNGEHERLVGSYDFYTMIKYSTFFNYVKYFYVSTEDKDALKRYERVNANADAILAGIEPEMGDLDKIIYLHDAIVELVTFNNNIGDQKYTLGGALGDKQAVCMGYATALNLLLKESGMDADYMRCDTENHGWSYVELDGEWYHIDPTWDDTRSTVKGQTSHRFLLRNDAEFMESGANYHGIDFAPDGGSPASSSDLYTDWFVHDIIGKMAFEDGLWYFVDPDTKDIACADAEGNYYETVVEYSGKALAVVDMEDTILTYTVAGNRVELDTALENLGGVELPEEEDGYNGMPEENTEVISGGESEVAAMLEDAALCDYNVWCAGRYSDYGVIEDCTGYSSTANRYYITENSAYTLTMKDTRFLLEVYEYDEYDRLLGVYTLSSGDCYVPDASVCSVGLSMYMPIWKTISFDEVMHKMKYDLHSVEFFVEKTEVIDPPAESEGKAFEEEEYIPVECDRTPLCDVNLSDYTIWCEGKYTEDGIEAYSGYCSTTECYGVQAGAEYALTMKDTRFNLIVYEFDSDNQLIAEKTLCSGDVLEPDSRTCHIGLSMYMPIWKDMAFGEVVTKLKYDLHTVELVLLSDSIVEEPAEEPSGAKVPEKKQEEDEVFAEDCPWEAVEAVDLSDYTLWCAGEYTEDASIENRVGYCSTMECYAVTAGGVYSLTMKDTRFKLVVFEYNGNNQLIAKTELSAGDIHIISGETCHAGFSMYMPIWKDLAFSEVAHKMKYNLHSVELIAY